MTGETDGPTENGGNFWRFGWARTEKPIHLRRSKLFQGASIPAHQSIFIAYSVNFYCLYNLFLHTAVNTLCSNWRKHILKVISTQGKEIYTAMEHKPWVNVSLLAYFSLPYNFSVKKNKKRFQHVDFFRISCAWLLAVVLHILIEFEWTGELKIRTLNVTLSQKIDPLGWHIWIWTQGLAF